MLGAAGVRLLAVARGLLHGQSYALFQTYLLIGLSLLIGTPFFLFFGAPSDRIGRKKIILVGCLIAAVT
jgi:MFS family permease